MAHTLPDLLWLRQFRRRLIAWFQKHGRDLPWRRRRDAYAVWISEIMLQQTQVATVRPYFERFLAAFPTIADLARADERDVLRLWEGLGYYRRARQLHAAAGVIAREHGGAFPRDFAAVSRLPGIGRYTAGAILSIACDARLPILEANTQRLYSRLLAYDGPLDSAAGKKLLWSFAEALLPPRDAGAFNQALMDLGSLLCTPRQPQCEACPVLELCGARQAGRVADIPRPKARPAIEAQHHVAVVIRHRGRVLLIERPEGERWAGLWDFPRFPVAAENGPALTQEIARGVLQHTGLQVQPGDVLTTIKHSVTRFRITLDCVEAQCVGKQHPVPTTMRWLRPDELADYPLSTTGRKIAKLLPTGC